MQVNKDLYQLLGLPREASEAVMSPGWVFVELDDRLSRVQRAELESVMNTCRQLQEL